MGATMTKWWVTFAIAIPVSYIFGVELAKSDSCSMRSPVALDSETKAHSIINQININQLKTVGCQLMYKVLSDDLQDKYNKHKQGKYTMSKSATKYYQGLVNDFNKNCPITDPIESNEPIKPIPVSLD
jgi:hypothetical protein